MAECTKEDADELRKFVTFLRLVKDAVVAGVHPIEAAIAIYPDLYQEQLEDGNGSMH